jgi:hypothetical protein
LVFGQREFRITNAGARGRTLDGASGVFREDDVFHVGKATSVG